MQFIRIYTAGGTTEEERLIQFVSASLDSGIKNISFSRWRFLLDSAYRLTAGECCLIRSAFTSAPLQHHLCLAFCSVASLLHQPSKSRETGCNSSCPRRTNSSPARACRSTTYSVKRALRWGLQTRQEGCDKNNQRKVISEPVRFCRDNMVLQEPLMMPSPASFLFLFTGTFCFRAAVVTENQASTVK